MLKIPGAICTTIQSRKSKDMIYKITVLALSFLIGPTTERIELTE